MAKAELPGSKLTSQQRGFAEAIASGMRIRNAALTAGYSPRTASSQASQQLNNPKVRTYIDSLRREVIEGVDEVRRTHIESLTRLRDLAIQQGKLAPALRAEELIGKVLGCYTTPANPEKTSKQHLENATTEEIREAVHEALPRLGFTLETTTWPN